MRLPLRCGPPAGLRRCAAWIALLIFVAASLPAARLAPIVHASGPTFVLSAFGDQNQTESVALGDLNGDGALDVVQGNYGQSMVYLNDKTGHFPNAIPFSNERSNPRIALGDLNGDGALDIVQGNFDAQSRVYLNDKTGHFPTSIPFGDASFIASIALGDLNGDGALDVVVGYFYSQQSRAYLNDKTGHFPTSIPFGGAARTTSIALGDLNGDGAPDIAQGNDGQQSQIYLNDKTGHFSSVIPFGSQAMTETGSIALGDLDGDGALDIVQGNGSGQSQVYLNDKTGHFPTSIPFGNATFAPSIALGDLNGDGALDIVQGRGSQESMFYLNDKTGHFPSGTPFGGQVFVPIIALGDLNGDGALDIVQGNGSGQSVTYLSVAASGFGAGTPFGSVMSGLRVVLGDLDGDGALDIVQGDFNGKSQVYLNDRQGHFSAGGLVGSDIGLSIALGDLDGDGALDIVATHPFSESQVYLNDRRGHFGDGRPLNAGSGRAGEIALGDLNGDGALDIVQSNSGQQSMIYLNDKTGRFPSSMPFGSENITQTQSIALGDLNGDGALDIVQDNYGQPSMVYLNNGYGSFPNAIPFSGVGRSTLGDLNGDGALDIVQSGDGRQSLIYLNDGAGHFSVGRPVGGVPYTTNVALGDLNGDGALDIVQANHLGQSMIYWNDRAGNFSAGNTFGDVHYTTNVALGDLDGDGALDIVQSNSGTPSQVYLNHQARADRLANQPPTVAVTRPGQTRDANFYSTAEILGRPAIPISYTLSDAESDPVRAISASFSLDGGGSWRPALAAAGTVTSDLTTSPAGITRVFNWDTFASGFFGQSDNVVIRITALPGVKPVRFGVPGPYQRAFVTATTFPFRARGTQVRVVGAGVPTKPPPVPIANPKTRVYLPLVRADSSAPVAVTNLGAEVYRIQAGQPGVRLADPSGQPFRTDLQGYLGGRGEIDVGDQLVALQPIAATATYTVYNTSAVPTLTGLSTYTVRASGVQTLTVSTANPLVLFNLNVSLEWDARADAQFLTQLGFDLRRVSELLYDWSNGQAALGDVTVYHAKQRWADADIRLAATNRLRPNADPGGIGQADKRIRIGAVWTRYGDAGGTLGEDWPRALAHEIGHYAFGLDDNYLGLDTQGRLAPVESCTGVMSDPYREDQSEFHAHADWLPACRSTLANKETGRADWENIVRAFPWLKQPGAQTPTFAPGNAGPNNLPLMVTRVRVVDPPTPNTTLAAPIFYLTPDGAQVLAESSARAFLFMCADGKVVGGVCQNDQWRDVVDLGQPMLDQVLARGARVGDRLCVYELAADRLGCENTRPGDTGLTLTAKPGWQPEVIVTPNSASSINVTVRNLPDGLPLRAQLFPAEGAATAMQMPSPVAGGYATTFTLTQPALAGYVHIWVDEAGTRREAVSDYGLGGSGSRSIRAYAPVLSPDGHVTLYMPGQTLSPGQFYTLQATTHLPTPPPWATAIGQAYRLTATGGATLANTSINFSYLGRDVPPGEERWVTVYYCPTNCPDDGSGWLPLPTTRDTTLNQAIAPTQGQGLYALMSSVEIPLVAGTNVVAYPVHTSRTVAKALTSIAGVYTLVRGYDSATHSWRALGSNDMLEFGKGYEITVARAITWRLKGDGVRQAGSTVTTAGGDVAAQPATYSGDIVSDTSWKPAPGLPVVAWVNGQRCGQGGTLTDGERVVYVVAVAAAGSLPGCGAPGRAVSFEIDGKLIATTALWDAQQEVEAPLRR